MMIVLNVYVFKYWHQNVHLNAQQQLFFSNGGKPVLQHILAISMQGFLD